MASISKDKNGAWILQYTLAGRRRSIWLGKLAKKDVETFRGHVEKLVVAVKIGTAPPDATAEWLGRLDVEYYRKLASHELVPPREDDIAANRVTLTAFIDRYLASRTDLQPGTEKVYKQTRASLITYFGDNKPIDEITAGDASEWRLWMMRPKKSGGAGLGRNTSNKRCTNAKKIFGAAVDHEFIERNPFAKLTNLTVSARAKVGVPRDVVEKILAHCPNMTWKTIVVLSRYAGLRIPSELRGLCWGHINFERGTMHVESPKTKSQGKASRTMPLFPEVLPFLLAARDELLADPNYDPKASPLSKQPVIRRDRIGEKNLRTAFRRICIRAGVAPWDSPFNAMRATRVTELRDTGKFSSKNIADWMGHTTAIADKHYAQTTDEHFARAASEPTGYLHKPMQTPADTSRQQPTAKLVVLGNLGESATSSMFGNTLVVREGFEPPTKGL